MYIKINPVLIQLLKGPVADGNLVSKDNRDALYTYGYCDKVQGFNIITAKGIEIAIELGLLDGHTGIAKHFNFDPRE